MYIRKYLIIYLLFINNHAFAEQLSIADAIKISLEQNLELATAKLIVEKAKARLHDAGRMENPELEFAWESDRSFQNEGENTKSVALKQKFPITNKLSIAKEVAQIDLAMAIAEINNQQRLLVGEVSLKMRALAVIDQRIKINSKLQKDLKELIEVSQVKSKAAEISITDLNFQKLELQNLELEKNRLKIKRKDLQLSLNVFLNRTADDEILVSESIELLLNPLTLEEAKDSALQKRGDLEMLSFAINRSKSEHKLAKASRWEDWTVGLEYKEEKSIYDLASVSSSKDEFFGVTLSIPLPLWNQRKGQVLEAQVSESQSLLQHQALELEIINEIESLYNQLSLLRSSLEIYQSKSLELAEANEKLIREGYLQGIVGINQLIQSRQQLAINKQGYADLLEQFYTTLTTFETVSASSPYYEELQ